MKNVYLVLVLFILQISGTAQEKKIYFMGGAQIPASLINENVAADSIKKVNTIFHFKNGIKHLYVKLMNVEGRFYGQGITEHVVLDFNSKKGGDLHRTVQRLTNIKVENGKFTSDQLKLYFVFLKEKEDDTKPILKLMVCTPDKKGGVINCRLNDDELPITPEELKGKYPYASMMRLGAEELSKMKSKELNIMKNEIYARYGYKFSDENDAKYFFNQDWYEPVYDNKKIELNELEQDNVNMISIFEGLNEHKDINKRSYSQILPIETASLTLFNKKFALKSVNYMKQDTLGGSKCLYTEYTKNGIASLQNDCMINKPIFVNYFAKDFLVENIDDKTDRYFYYDKEGLPVKTVKVNYKDKVTEESLYYYDSSSNINKKEIYKNNELIDTIYYEYDSEGNLVKEYHKDDNGKEIKVTEFYFDTNNMYVGYLKNNLLGCDFSFNKEKDIITKTQCYRRSGKNTIPTTKSDSKIIESHRGKQKRIISYKAIESDAGKYGMSITEVKYQ